MTQNISAHNLYVKKLDQISVRLLLPVGMVRQERLSVIKVLLSDKPHECKSKLSEIVIFTI